MHDLNLQLAKICILLLAKFFIIKVFKNSEVKDTGNKLTSVCEWQLSNLSLTEREM